MSGKLLKLGETDDDFGEDFNAEGALIYGEKDVNASSNGDFAPYRFIALKPKKLVIASDGGYGQEGTTVPQNKNRVLVFTLDGSGNIGNRASEATFSKELGFGTCGFTWE